MTIGVYKITNLLNNKKYIGASVNAEARRSNHFNRDARAYYGKSDLHTDVIDMGKENFKFEIIHQCEKDELIHYEQLYYDLDKPEYNKYRPEKCMFSHKEIGDNARRLSNTPEKVAERKKLYNSPEYKELFRNVHVEKMKAINMLKDGVVIKSFISMQEGSRYITDNSDFKGVNKTSKIKAVCDGNRKSAFGYQWEYKKV